MPPNLYELSADGSGTERLLLKTPFPKGPTGWSSDGRRLVFNSRQPRTGGDVWVLPLDPPGAAAVPVVATAADEGYGTLSPDGHWLAYVSNESALYQVYLQAFPGPGLRRQVSANGGLEPQWSRDGKELFYLAPDQTLMAVSVRSTPSTVELSSAQGVIHHARQLDRGAGGREALRGVSRCDEVPHQPIGQAAGGSDQRRAELTGDLAKMSRR